MSPRQQAVRTDRHRTTERRVALRPLSEADLPLVETWYGRAAAAVAGLRTGPVEVDLRRHLEEARAQPGRELSAIVLPTSREVVGLLDQRAPYPAAGWLTVGFLALAEPCRGRGLGSEAVLALEEEASGLGLARRFAAGVGADAGRVLYFWLRLGYRPLLQAHLPWPSPRKGVVWMVRETE